MSHRNGVEFCDTCEEKLKDAHPYLLKWFRKVKARHPQVHVSWAHRDKDSQEQAFSEGRTHLHFPASKHNKLPAEALDLFELTDIGTAQFSSEFYKKLAAEVLADGDEITWAGRWTSFIETDHFQYNPSRHT